MGEEKISVIVPVYNTEAYLRQCLDSIAAQTYRNLEVILVDDGSPDGCPAICDEYAARDSRFQVIHKENGGVSSARNAGLARASGEWIGWVDGDDYIEPDMFAYLLENAKAADAEVAVCGVCKVRGDRREVIAAREVQVLDNEGAMAVLLENEAMQSYCCDKLWRRALWEGVTFPPGLTFEDMRVVPQVFRRAKTVVRLPGVKYFYRQHPGSIVADCSLERRLSHWDAARYRYETLRESYPQLEELLLDQLVASAMGVWTARGGDRTAEKARLSEISRLCAGHVPAYLQRRKQGLAGRTVVKLLPYPRGWARALARVISRLYERKHGTAL